MWEYLFHLVVTSFLMNVSINFDETPLKKDFGSFSLYDITSESSITSIIKSIFTPGTRVTWNDAFKFAHNKNCTYCAILIGKHLFSIFCLLADRFMLI